MTYWARMWDILCGERGNLQFGGGDQRQQQTETRQIAAASPQEQQLQAINLWMAQQQAQQMQAAMEEQNAYAKSPQAMQNAKLQEMATQNLLNRLAGNAPVLTPDQEKMLNEAYASTNRQGMEDLARFAQEQAAQRGMTTADSPVGNEALRQARLFQADLASKKSQSALDLSQTGANFNQSIAQFQAGLQQQALQNRMALSSATPASYGMQNNLFAQRLAAAPRSMSGYGGGNQYGYGANFGQFGQGLGGLGSAFETYSKLYGTPGLGGV